MKESTKLNIAAFVAGVLLALLFVLPADAVTPEQIAVVGMDFGTLEDVGSGVTSAGNP
ncbi:MAG: hypothetical protein KKC03_13160 [Bacteroidetes bacterium]|nr:hypothetical protein [Bacteroidota bacterium]